jgi:Clostridial hydrophobic W
MSEALTMERKKAKVEHVRQAAVQTAAPGVGQLPDPSSRVAELQVSAHLMTLETGLFCVFQSAGSPAPDPASGLPGVRITPAPGSSGRPDAVSVSTFRPDGWLNGTAALVRVANGTAQILVTIYQQKGKDAAPKLQVLRLSGEPGAAVPEVGTPATAAVVAAPVKAPRPEAPNPEVMAHIQRMGDVGCKLGEWLGSKGSRQWVEGFGMAPGNGIAAQDVEYQAVLGRDWLSPWVESGKFCGSRGMALPLLGLRVRLKGAAAKDYECSYSATFIDGTAIGPVSAGEACEAESLAALEAFQIVVQPRATAAAAAAMKPINGVASRPAQKAPGGKIVAASKAVPGLRRKA